MLRISIVIITFLALGNVGAKTYKRIESVDFTVENNENPFFGVRVEISEQGPIYWLDILETVKSKRKLRVCEKWQYDNNGYAGATCGIDGIDDIGGIGGLVPPYNRTIYGPVCHKLCSVLKHLSYGEPDYDYPGLDIMLGLRGQRCPLREGSSFLIPRVTMPEKIHVHHHMERDYVDYEASILPSVHCATKRSLPFLKTTLVFVPCKRKHRH